MKATMNTKWKKLSSKFAVSALALVGAFFCATSAQAEGTPSGTNISNIANLNFAINGVSQPAITSNTVFFLVDTKINMALIEDNGGVPTTVAPGSTRQVIRFKLTNLGNAKQDFQFPLTSMPTGTTAYGMTDNFTPTICQAYADSSANNGVFDELIDTNTYADELQPDASKYIFVRCDIPASQVDSDFAVMRLRAQAMAGGTTGSLGSGLQQTTGPNTNGVDVVFADPGGPFDAERDNLVTAFGAYLVKSSKVSVVKTTAPLCDPVNFNTDPKNIPGAYIRYSITIANAAGAGASANLNGMTDVLPLTNLVFDPNLIAPTDSSCDTTTPPESAAGSAFKFTCTGGSRACTAAPVYKTSAADADGLTFSSPTVSANFAAALPVESNYGAGELKAGESVKFEFNVRVK